MPRRTRHSLNASIHQELDKVVPKIRLLKLLPLRHGETTESKIRCSMFDTPVSVLGNRIKFDALSYAWGDPTDTIKIAVNGFPLAITRKLHEALVTFREIKEMDRYLWADAICIDQRNVQERNHQVTMMKDIYGLATSVSVWLGKAVRDTPLLFAYLQRWSDGGRSMELASLDGLDVLVETLGALCDLIWWRRLWVVPEVVLARDANARWGPYPLPFDTLSLSLREILVLLSSTPYSLRHDYESKLNLDRALNVFGVELARRMQSVSWILHDVTDLLGCIAHRETSEERDRVYGIMSLFTPTLDLVPNYSAKLAEVFEQGTVALMHLSKSPALVSITDHTLRRPDLPSWVMDFGAIIPYAHPQSYKPDGGLVSSEQKCFVHKEAGQLLIRSLVVDEISWIGPQTEIFMKESTKIMGFTSEALSALRTVWSTYESTLEQSRAKSAFEVFWCAMLLWVFDFPEVLTALAMLADQLARMFADTLEMECGQFTEKWTWEVQLVLQNWRSVRTVFYTRWGMVGSMGPAEVEPGDLVAILSRIPFPIILRPVSHRGMSAYRVVTSNVYCSHVMAGEAVRATALQNDGDEENIDGVFEEILLV